MDFDLYLELYKGKIPDFFKDLDGSDNYDEGMQNHYWAVLIPKPDTGTDAANFIAPVEPGAGVNATTHGSDTLPQDMLEFKAAQACIWDPKNPPYSFRVIPPSGGGDAFSLEAPGDSSNQANWHCQPVPVGNGIGIWVIAVLPRGGSDIPVPTDGRNAHLNPDFLDFDASFYQQPLLRIKGSSIPTIECPEVSIEITPGACDDGLRTVHFKAEVVSTDDATYTWFFGASDDYQEGEDSQAGDGNGNIWLPQPDANGVRVVETDHVYESTSEQPQTITVRLETSTGPTSLCTAEQTFTLEPCKPTEMECPTGKIEITDGPSPECINGKRRVELLFTITLEGSDPATEACIDFGDDSGQDLTISSDTVLSIDHDYQAPESGALALEYTPQIDFTPKVKGCDPVVLGPPISIPPCECSKYSITDIEITPGDCVDGEREITATVSAEGPDSPSSYEWEWSDGHNESSDNDSVHKFESFASAEASVAVVVTWPNGCTDIQTKPFTVESCEEKVQCPEINGISFNEEDCSNSGERTVTLTAQVTGQIASGFTWDFGDGTPPTIPIAGPISPPHNYTPGTWTVSVKVSGPSGCDDASFEKEITVAACPDPPPPPDDPPPPPPRSCIFNWCLIWLWTTFGLSLLAGVAIAVTACILYATAATPVFWVGVGVSLVLVLVTILSFILWAIFCSQLPSLCRPLVWIRDILALLSASSFILAMMQGFTTPCAIGFLLNFAYYGILASILEIIIRSIGCPFGRNGVVGFIFDVINWVRDLLGLGNGR